MATLLENINIISTAIYGKEMRPAISEALRQSMDLLNRANSEAADLKKRLDSIENSGSGGGSGGEDIAPPVTGINVSGLAEVSIDAVISNYIAGEAIAL